MKDDTKKYQRPATVELAREVTLRLTSGQTQVREEAENANGYHRHCQMKQ